MTSSVASPLSPREFLDPLGRALRLIRRRFNLRQKEVASLTGFSSGMISSYENGHCFPNLTSLCTILLSLRCDFHDLQDAFSALPTIRHSSPISQNSTSSALSTTSKRLLVRRPLPIYSVRITMPPEDFPSIPPKEFLAPLGAALRLIRDRRNLKQYQAAEMAGMTKAMLSSYETGKALPSLLSLAAILVALNSDFRELQEALYSSAQPDSPLRQEAAPDEPASTTEESSLPLGIAVGRLEAQLSRAADALELLAGRRKRRTSRPSKLRESERPSTARP